MFFYFFAGYIDASLQKKTGLRRFLLLYDRRALKCPTGINQMNQINWMRFALFCDRAHWVTVVAIAVDVHAVATTKEVEAERVVFVAI